MYRFQKFTALGNVYLKFNRFSIRKRRRSENKVEKAETFNLEILDDSFVAEDLKLFDDDRFDVGGGVGRVGVDGLDHATIACA